MHLEFTVAGPPVSSQVRDRVRIKNWQALVRTTAAAHWAGRSLLAGRLKCTILHFYEEDHPPIDDDNLIKPIRDALQGVVYRNDSQIHHSETILISIEAVFKTRGVSPAILMAMSRGEEFVYIRIEDAPIYTELPRRA